MFKHAIFVIRDIDYLVKRGDYWLYHKLVPEVRYFGYLETWHDGPIYTFGFWWFSIGAGGF